MRNIIPISAIMLLLISILVSIPGDAETEPNDSLDSPEILSEGTITGELNTNITDEDLFEKDCFRLDMDRGVLYIVSIKKTDTLPNDIEVTYYNDLVRQIGFPSALSVAGQRTTWDLRPLDDETRFIVVSGKGEYAIEVFQVDVNDDDDHGGEFSEPKLLGDGDILDGKVFEIEHNGTEYSDVDVFMFKLDTSENLIVDITRTDDGDGTLELKFYNDVGTISSIEKNAKLKKLGDEKTFEYEYTYTTSDVVYLRITGEGDYNIEVTQEAETISEEEMIIMLSMLAMMMCLPIIGFLVPVIIIIIVIVIIVKGQKKKEFKRREK